MNAPHVRQYVTEASGTDNNNNNNNTHTHFITENYFITKYTTFVITYLFNYLKITLSAKSTNDRNSSGRHLNFFFRFDLARSKNSTDRKGCKICLW